MNTEKFTIMKSPRLLRNRRPLLSVLLGAAVVALGGCAFDLVSVTQTPATLVPVSSSEMAFTLQQDVVVPIGTGFPTHLKKGTVWRQVGVIDQGVVYTTRDQVVTVEASNIHEAQIVVSKGRLIGFYLPVERSFAAAKEPMPLDTQPAKS